MFGTIRRHQSWLWFIVVAVVIVSFVIFFDPSQKINGGRGQGGSSELGRIGDHVVTPQELIEAQREFRLIYFLNTHKWPEEDRERAAQIDETHEAAIRLLGIVKAKEAGITVPDSAVVEMSRRLLGPNANLDQVVKEVLGRGGITADDFARFVRHELMRQQLVAVVGVPGRMVTPTEAEEEYRREHQEIASQLVMFNVSNYMAKVAVSNDTLMAWFTNNMPRYRTFEKVRVSYVAFPASNYLADVDKEIAGITNLSLQLEQIYAKMGTNAFKETNGVVMSHDQAIAKIKSEQREAKALFNARRHANDFGNKLMDLVSQTNVPPNAAMLDQVAAAEKVSVRLSEPFDVQDGPTNLNVGADFTRAAFSMTSTNPISFQPLQGEDAYYLIALKETIPSRQESYAEVKDKALDDYKRTQAFTLMYQDATSFHTKATNELAKGKSLDEVAAQSGLKVVTLPPVSLRTESLTNLDSNLDIRRLRSSLFTLEPGKVSNFNPNPPVGGYIAYVKQKLPIDEAKLKTDLPKFMAEIRYQRQNEVFNNWFRKEYEKAVATFPLLNQQRQNQNQRRG